MNKIVLILATLTLSVVIASAQSTNFNKTEYYVGYSNGQVDTGTDSGNSINSFFNDRENFHGFETAGVYNVSRYIGIKGDFSGTYKRDSVNSAVSFGATTARFTASTTRSLYNLLGGVQVKDNASDKRLKPFAHALVGWGHARESYGNVSCSPTALCNSNNIVNSTFTSNGVAGAFGGGLDVKLNDKIDIRAVQVDYNPIRFNGVTDHNLRLGVGIVIK